MRLLKNNNHHYDFVVLAPKAAFFYSRLLFSNVVASSQVWCALCSVHTVAHDRKHVIRFHCPELKETTLTGQENIEKKKKKKSLHAVLCLSYY